MTDSDIESFIRAFEDGSLPKSEWTHSNHLVMALWYLTRHDRDEAIRLIRTGIQRYNERKRNFTGYHETITLAWVAVIERFLGAHRPGCGGVRAGRGVARTMRRQGLLAAVLLEGAAFH